jgi:signal transduction histidine kinase
MNEAPTLFPGRAVFRVAMLIGTVLVAAAAFQAAGPNREPKVLFFLGVLEGSIVLAWAGNSIRPHPVLPAAMAAAGLAGLAASSGPIAGFGVFMALVSARTRFPLLYAAPLGALVVILPEVLGGRWRSPPLWIAFEAVGVAAAFLGAVGLRQVREQQAGARAALDELDEMREFQARAARGAERVRLAREIHDVLGSTLSDLSMEIENARLELVQRSEDPAVRAAPAALAALAALDRAQALTRESMEEARSALATLRGDPSPGPALLADLVSAFERDSGVEAQLRVEGRSVELAPEARLAVYRTARAALVNVGKHARAHRVEVRLRYQADGAELTVDNDGGSARQSSNGGSPQPSSAGGRGLNAIRDRAELLGGHLETGPTERGFRVRLWLPSARVEDDPEEPTR